MAEPPSPASAQPPAQAAAPPADWRSEVLLSYRNNEVREISKVLAALEPDATPQSKLSLAMRFEDGMFKSASSLTDYKKKITKRLKKLQKNYVPPPDKDPSAPKDKEALEKEREALLLRLQQKWGEPLRYIHQHADTAVAEIRKRMGDERATQLEQHTKSATQWAMDLGVLDKGSMQRQATIAAAKAKAAAAKEKEKAKAKSTKPTTKPSSSSSSTPPKLSVDHLKRIEQHLERRVDNIRNYVVKHAQPDVFLVETLVKRDSELAERPIKMLGVNLRKRMEQIQKYKLNETQLLQTSLEKAATPVPPPTRNRDNDKQASLLHLDRMRAASAAVLAYLSHTNRTTAPKDTLQKSHAVATEGVAFIQSYMAKIKKQKEAVAKQRQLLSGSSGDAATNADGEKVTSIAELCSLQDAWNKVMELPQEIDDAAPSTADDGMAALGGASAAESGNGSHTPPSDREGDPAKRRKLNDQTSTSVVPSATSASASGSSPSHPPIIKTKVLLAPNRRVPPNLVAALKRKQAKLVRPPPSGMGSHIVLGFGTAFTMTIYLSPLLVCLRAMTRDEKENAIKTHLRSTAKKASDAAADQASLAVGSMLDSGITRLRLLSHGLVDQQKGEAGSSTQRSTATPASNQQTMTIQRPKQLRKSKAAAGSSSTIGGAGASASALSELTVWGVTGSYDSIGHVVEERLRDASMRCTSVLRQCFGNTIKNGNGSDFEIEILEATALLEFLQVARSTYNPGWKDQEDD